MLRLSLYIEFNILQTLLSFFIWVYFPYAPFHPLPQGVQGLL